MKFHRFFVSAALLSAMALPTLAEDDVLDAAQLGRGQRAPVRGQVAPLPDLGADQSAPVLDQAATLPAPPALDQVAPLPSLGETGQLTPVVIDLQGQGPDGSTLPSQATLTPLGDGRVRVQQSLPDRAGRSTLQEGVGTIQGNELRVDLLPAQGGLNQVLDGPGALQPQALPVTISVDPQSGAVQSQCPTYQGQAQDKSHKVRDFFRNAGSKTVAFMKSAGKKTMGFFGRIGAFFKNMFLKIKSFFSRKKAAPSQEVDVAPTPIQDLPAITPIQQLPAIQPTPIQNLPRANQLPALGEELPVSSQAAAG